METAPDRQAVLAALRASGGNVGRAAHALGCSRRTLQNRMREYGIPRSRGGRPKRKLSYRKSGTTIGLLGGAIAVAGYLALRRKA